MNPGSPRSAKEYTVTLVIQTLQCTGVKFTHKNTFRYVNVGIVPVMNETMLRVVYYVGIC
jgi:hypothetical protein